MHAENTITIKAPIDKIFAIASDLSKWPEILPHYRWVRFLNKSDGHSIVNMAARRGQIPIQWTSEYWVDSKKTEMHFKHLKAFTKGMHVIWTFTSKEEAVEVRIRHDLDSAIPILGRFISEVIIAKFFIHHVANQTLKHMKLYLEAS